ncbi:MAG: MBL fold metallo-hydrolase [Roseomonas sp.]|nr:MBL fold metallo-hydrolase [Roseomonas sp.]
MRKLTIGDVTITSIIERDGPWRAPGQMFPDAPADQIEATLKELEPETYDAASGKMVITYQTYVVRTPRHTILVDTCTGEDKGYPAPMDFPKQPWLDGLKAEGLSFDDIDYVMCTHLHIDHSGWNTVLRDGRWVPTFPRAKYIFHKREYAAWEASTKAGETRPGGGGSVFTMNCEPVVAAGQAMLVDDDFSLDDCITIEPTPGHTPCHCCVHIKSGGQHAVITGDLMHHALQIHRPSWSTMFCWDPIAAADSRTRFLGNVADTDTKLLPIHFPNPSVGRVESNGDRFRWRYMR